MTTRSGRPAEEGAAAVLLLILTPSLFGLAGLVLDGGRQLAARQQAADLAEQAARAGADHLDITALRAGAPATFDADIDVDAARAAACRYVTTADASATCTATLIASSSGEQVQVRVRTSTATVLLGLVGINRLHSDATATATAVTGIRSSFGHG